MSNIHILKDSVGIKTSSFIFSSIITGGIFPLIWLTKHYQTIEEITGSPKSENLEKGIIGAATGVALILRNSPLVGLTNNPLIPVWVVLGIVLTSIFWLSWAFKTKKALEAYAVECGFELNMNSLYTFLFNVVYINHCINDLPEAVRRNKNTRENIVEEPVKEQ